MSETSAPHPTAAATSTTLTYCAAFVGLGLVVASLGPTLPGLAEQTGTRLSEISILFTARALGYLLGALQGSRLYDRGPGHRLMAAALLTMAVTLAAVPLTRRLWLLTAVSLLLGLAESVLDVGGNTLLVWALGARVAPYMNALHFAFGVGAFLSPLVVERAVTATGGIAWAYWSLALLVLPVAAVVLRLSPPAAAAGVADGRAAPVDRRLVGLVAVFFFLYCGAEVSFGGWIFTYAVALGMGDETTGAYLTSAFWGAFTLGRLLAIPIATRASARSVILADLVGCLISVGIVLGWSGSSAALWIGTIGSGLSMASIFPTTLSLAERRLQITGRVTGWFFVGVSIGGMFLPWLIGQLFESIGPRVLMIALTVDLAAALGIFAVLLRAPARPARVA